MTNTKEYWEKYYQNNRKKIIGQRTEYNKEYAKTPMGRAQRQYQQYKFMDTRNGFGDVIDFDAKWIVENIYNKKCAHCNCVLNGKESSKRVKQCGISKSRNVSQYTIDGELLAVFCSTAEAERQTNIPNGNISACCRGVKKTAGGFKWEYN